MVKYKYKDLENCTAIVTGASGGFGKHISHALAKQGMNVVLAARSHEKLEQLAKEIVEGEKNGTALAVPTDITKLDELSSLVTRAKEEYEHIDVVVNNAGLATIADFSTLSATSIQDLLEVNVLAPMQLTRLVLPDMLARKRGHIVNVASIAGKLSLPRFETYVASKSALFGFTRSIRTAYKNQGVNASIVAPGFAKDSGMYHRIQDTSQIKPTLLMRLLATISPEAVGKGVVKALKKNKGEVYVMPRKAGSIRLLVTLYEASPWFSNFMMTRTGVLKYVREASTAYDAKFNSAEEKAAEKYV